MNNPYSFLHSKERNFKAIYKYRVSHQYGNTFNFDYLILYQCCCKSKTYSEKLRFKPSRGHLDFDFFQKIWLFFRVGKKTKQKWNFFWRHATLFFSKCPKILFSQIHVTGYMDFCFFFKSMYPGTWTFVSSSNPCSGYMEFCFFFKFIYPGTWIWENKILGHFEKKRVAWRQKNSFLFRFLPILKNKFFFWKKSKSRWPFEGLNLSFSEEVLLLQ